MAAALTMGLQRRAVAAALAFLLAAFLAGVSPGPGGLGYRTAGLTEGILSLLLTYAFLQRGIWWSPAPVLRWVAIVYGTAATAQLLELLLPAPGVLEWLVLTGVAFSIWAVLGGRDRTRVLMGLATMALLLAVLKFSVVPVLWERSGPGPGEAWGLGDLAEGLRRLIVDYEPISPAGQLVGFVAIGFWAVGTRLLWREGLSAGRARRKP